MQVAGRRGRETNSRFGSQTTMLDHFNGKCIFYAGGR
jgi:hypothetical protein